MELQDVEEIFDLLDSCILRIKWRLRPSSKRRLGTDFLALCTGLRAVVMVDYGGKMPELQDRLCDLLSLMCKECAILLSLRILVIDDMIYIIHSEGHTELSNLSLEQRLLFVDLEVDPPQLLLPTNQTMAVSEFLSVQKLFLSLFPDDAFPNPLHRASSPAMVPEAELSVCKATNVARIADPAAHHSCEIIDLTSCLRDAQITIPALNGWLLGYPVVYLFRKEHATDAVYNLSTKNLHIYRIIICRLRNCY
ncbi:hypothetical protein AXF42_Ash012082 [Apostasia shenzhenica]|uniref:Uncharacterized protein n=1 Tax=Apostasia shenzhenica TaxID=1088818 RepID=A0A2I0AJS1_9ASPA|nr:hypothetical protein AXF42_Ash012082 [Apostasia shenzhenica]